MATKKTYFRTPVDVPRKIETPSGDKIEDVWAMKYDEQGNEIFYVEGKTNVYEKIQAHLEETKIENILQKCIDTGDESILYKVKGAFADLTEMPKNIFEANERIKKAEETFNNLPLNLRKEYDFSFEKYLADFGSENWKEKMGLNNEETKDLPANKETTKGEENE